MEITAVETVYLGGSSTCIKVETDGGVAGYGEGVVETTPFAVLSVVDALADQYLIGTDPFAVQKHRRRMQDALWYYEGPVSMGAVAGVEQALWDIKGKALGVPVYELLGGAVRDSVRTYKWIGAETRGNLPEQAVDLVSRGFDALKFSPTPDDPSPYPRVIDEAVEVVRSVREAVGPDVDLMLDPASRWKPAEAERIVPELREFDPLFVEDFVHPKPISVVADLVERIRVPYALGDRLTGFREFQEVLDRNAAAVLQPDVCHSGGLLELSHVAAAAEQKGVRIAPHNPQGPIATAAAVHLDLTIPNFLVQEVAGTEYYGAWNNDHIDSSVVDIEDGHISRPEAPGLGIEVDDAVFEEEYGTPADTPLFVDTDDFHVPEW
jgi:galactonate dehydratase